MTDSLSTSEAEGEVVAALARDLAGGEAVIKYKSPLNVHKYNTISWLLLSTDSDEYWH